MSAREASADGVAVTPARANGSLAEIAALVNDAYLDAEAGMWAAGTARVSERELRAVVDDGELLVARVGGRLAGCVRVHPVSPGIWSFGMLASHGAFRGAGVGGALVDAAESWALRAGAATLQLELLVPLTRAQPSKIRLAGWYRRLGYVLVRVGSMEREHPDLAEHLVVPVEYQIWQKPLRDRSPER